MVNYAKIINLCLLNFLFFFYLLAWKGNWSLKKKKKKIRKIFLSFSSRTWEVGLVRHRRLLKLSIQTSKYNHQSLHLTKRALRNKAHPKSPVLMVKNNYSQQKINLQLTECLTKKCKSIRRPARMSLNYLNRFKGKESKIGFRIKTAEYKLFNLARMQNWTSQSKFR